MGGFGGLEKYRNQKWNGKVYEDLGLNDHHIGINSK